MGRPSVATQKRLFAVSGNRCAFRQCRQPLVDDVSGKVTARICHIKGNKPGAKRHDPNQSEGDRQGFANLLLMCPIHHDVIDADDVTFSVAVLKTIKAEHEAKYENVALPEKHLEEMFLENVSLEATDGSIILSANQSGGQIAHTIHNNYGGASPSEQIVLRPTLEAIGISDVIAVGQSGVYLVLKARFKVDNVSKGKTARVWHIEYTIESSDERADDRFRKRRDEASHKVILPTGTARAVIEFDYLITDRRMPVLFHLRDGLHKAGLRYHAVSEDGIGASQFTTIGDVVDANQLLTSVQNALRNKLDWRGTI